MAEIYGLKYYAEFRNTRGHDYRLEVRMRGYTGGAKEMKNLCACVLEIQGGMGDIISPIIKTQLRFSLVDAWDIEETEAAKYGDWQEFFTPDSTLYQVSLADEQSTIWTGYITPDSWLEDLDYRGAVTITARDNIGHLQDFPFEATGDATPDENGLVQIKWIISQALKVVDFPMRFAMEDPSAGVMSNIPETEDEEPITNGYVNVSLFKDMNWYEVLEKTLESIGYVFRYVGNDLYACSTLRGMPLLGHWRIAVGTQEMEFYGGTLELDPAVKKIEELQDYKADKETEVDLRTGLSMDRSQSNTYRCFVESAGSGYSSDYSAPYNTVLEQGSSPWPTNTRLLNQYIYGAMADLVKIEGKDGWKNYAFLPCNNWDTSSPMTQFRLRAKTTAVKLTFEFAERPLRFNLQLGRMERADYVLGQIQYLATYESNDGTMRQFWNGSSWSNTPPSQPLVKNYTIEQNKYDTIFELELSENLAIDNGDIVVYFYCIKYYNFNQDRGRGCYARLANVTCLLTSGSIIKSNKVTTINNDVFNVKITRNPLFGLLSQDTGFVTPANYQAGVFIYPDGSNSTQLMDYRFRMPDTHVLVPFPVLVHQQILCYYYGAARVLNGSCAPVAKAPFDFGQLCTYKGFTYLLQGGTLDFFRGVIDGAVLREFVHFEDLWDPDEPPQYEEDVTYNG